MAIEFKSYGYRIDSIENNIFLGVIFTETWNIYYTSIATENQKQQILTKMKELQNDDNIRNKN